MQYGQDAEFLEELWHERNPDTGEFEEVEQIDNRPELEPQNRAEYRAFGHLSASRFVGFGRGPIPPEAVFAWQEKFHAEYDLDEALSFLHRIAKMDEAYLKFHQDKDDAGAGEDGKGKKERTETK